MKQVIVTGATGAIGSAICEALAGKGYGLILACRNLRKVEDLASRLPKGCRVTFLHLDLADADSVHASVAELARLVGRTDSIAGVINNAGVMARRYIETREGHEMDMTVNYLNTRLWTRLLLQSGLLARGSSVVFTTSLTRLMGWGRELPKEHGRGNFSQLGTYGASKRALTLYAGAASERLVGKGIFVNCADPGVVDSGMITMGRWFDPISDLVFRPFIRSPRMGAIPALRAFEAGVRGRYGCIFCRYATHKIPVGINV